MLFLSVCTIGLTSGYLILTDKVTAGYQKIADGQKQLQEGQQMLAKGKIRLAEGRKKLESIKRVRNTFTSIPILGKMEQVLPVSGAILAVANTKIAEGGDMVAKGQLKIKAGEKQLAEGKLQLSRGENKLSLANRIRIACGVSAILFFLSTIGLGFYWRKSLKKIIKQKINK